jgi:hypothetical protein
MDKNKEKENVEEKGAKKLTYADVVRQAQINKTKDKQQNQIMISKQ